MGDVFVPCCSVIKVDGNINGTDLDGPALGVDHFWLNADHLALLRRDHLLIGVVDDAIRLLGADLSRMKHYCE